MVPINEVLFGLLILDAVIILLLGFFSWKRRKISGVFSFFALCMCAAFYAFFYGLEMVSPTVEMVNWCSKAQYIGLSAMPALWITQAIRMTSNRKKLSPYWGLIFIIPVITLVLRWTNESHHLIYQNMTLVDNGYFSVLHFDRGIWYVVHYTFFSVCLAGSIGIYGLALLHSGYYEKKRLFIMFMASIIPVASVIMNQLRIVPLQLDSGPFFSIILYTLFAYGIFKHDMIHLVPISREKTFDWISDGAIVVNLELELEDFNPAAREIFPELNEKNRGESIDKLTKPAKLFGWKLEEWYGKMVTNPDLQLDESMRSFEFEIETGEYERNNFQARPMLISDKSNLLGITVLITNISKEKEMLRRLKNVARIDEMTQLYNRRYFIECMMKLREELMATQQLGYVIMFDIDHFKQVNDKYGHQVGDYVLKKIGELSKEYMWEKGICGRYGGEEFIIFCPGGVYQDILDSVEKFRRGMEQYQFQHEEVSIQVTASFGVASLFDVENQRYRSFDEMIKVADDALYRAKNEGRNRVIGE